MIKDFQQRIAEWIEIMRQLYRCARSIQWPRSSQSCIYPSPKLDDDSPKIRLIDNLEDLDAALLEAEKAFQVSDDEGRRKLASIRYKLPNNFPSDPYSPEYAEAQMQLYLALSKRSTYDPWADERTLFDLQAAKRSPFPYSTSSPTTVGDQLIAQGFLIRAMALLPGAKIVEFGPGWGNTTLHLAQMGYRVTAVEIEKSFVELIRSRAQAVGVDVELFNQDMLAFQPSSPHEYDAALFFESFHHCSDHLRMLRNLDTLISPDGLIAFAGEPIDSFSPPWGFVRSDGLALWSIRRYGWFELGFDISYFLRTLLFFGWLPHYYTSDVSPLAKVIIAKRSQGFYSPADFTLPPDEATTWASSELSHRFTTGRSVMSCARNRPVEAVEFCLSNFSPDELNVTLTAGQTVRKVKLPAGAREILIRVEPKEWQGQVIIASQTWRPARVFGSPDQRTLGVAVHWLRLLAEKSESIGWKSNEMIQPF